MQYFCVRSSYHFRFSSSSDLATKQLQKIVKIGTKVVLAMAITDGYTDTPQTARNFVGFMCLIAIGILSLYVTCFVIYFKIVPEIQQALTDSRQEL